jgi:hypothetical protein
MVVGCGGEEWYWKVWSGSGDLKRRSREKTRGCRWQRREA